MWRRTGLGPWAVVWGPLAYRNIINKPLICCTSFTVQFKLLVIRQIRAGIWKQERRVGHMRIKAFVMDLLDALSREVEPHKPGCFCWMNANRPWPDLLVRVLWSLTWLVLDLLKRNAVRKAGRMINQAEKNTHPTKEKESLLMRKPIGTKEN